MAASGTVSKFVGRAALGLATLLTIAVATFFLMHSIPGGPFSRERALPPEIEQNMLRKYNLDLPLGQQLVRYLGSLARGDLGPSFVHEGRSTNAIISEGFPKSATLGLSAFVLAFGIGIPLGISAALRRARLADQFLMTLAVLGVSVPGFIIASILQYWLSYRFGWLPSAGWGDSPLQLVMPAAALAAFPAAFVSRLARASMLDVLTSDYLRTARAKGLGPRLVVLRHALRNALLPLVTYSGPLLAGLMTGSFVIENIFAIPGLGNFFVTSITDRDYTVIMGITLFYSALIITFNLLTDAIYLWLDPRIEL